VLRVARSENRQQRRSEREVYAPSPYEHRAPHASLATIMHRYGIRTKTEAVDLALCHLAGQPMSTDEALAMPGARALMEPFRVRADRLRDGRRDSSPASYSLRIRREQSRKG